MKKFNEIFVDFDETIVNSLMGICNIYNNRYNLDANWRNSKLWSLKDVCPLFKDGEVVDLFSSDPFFKGLTLKEGSFEVLTELSKDYIITIVSIGTMENCSKKLEFINANFPFVSKSILIPVEKDKLVMDKSSVDMSNGIFIDDVEDNLFSSNAAMQILYENIPNTDWNSKWHGERIKSWYDFYKYFE